MEVRTSQHQAFFIGKDVKTKGGREFWVFFDVKAVFSRGDDEKAGATRLSCLIRAWTATFGCHAVTFF